MASMVTMSSSVVVPNTLTYRYLLRCLIVLWCLIGFTLGGSLFEQLEVTTPKSPYSQGTSLIYHVRKNEITFHRREGPHSHCSHRSTQPKECYCERNYNGTPPRCHPTPEYWDLCVEDNPCGIHSECEITNATRECSCISGFEGTPPNCHPEPDYQYCEVENQCGPNSECDAIERQCYCLPGFVGNPPNCTAGTELVALCNPYPCGGYSNCSVQDGVPVCTCLAGYLGEPPNCAPGPELWRVCFKDSPCGKHSHCTIQERVAVCSPCGEGYSDEPPFCNLPLTSDTD